jgi:hypothetical protein
LQELGLEITELNALTGLPEDRNGGLCLDLGLLQAKHSNIFQHSHCANSEVIVEWRALTVILLDGIAETMREKLKSLLTPAVIKLAIKAVTAWLDKRSRSALNP